MQEFSASDEIESLKVKIEELSEIESEQSVRLELAERNVMLQQKKMKRKTILIYRLRKNLRRQKSFRASVRGLKLSNI